MKESAGERMMLGLSVSNVARWAYVSRDTVRAYERGEHMRTDTDARLARVYGLIGELTAAMRENCACSTTTEHNRPEPVRCEEKHPEYGSQCLRATGHDIVHMAYDREDREVTWA